MEIKTFDEADFAQISEIYKEGIETGHATFQDEIPTWKDWDKSHLKTCRLAMFENGKIVGWVALTPVSSRCVYAGVAEISIYIRNEFRGKGYGKFYSVNLPDRAKKKGFGLYNPAYLQKIWQA